MKASINDYLKQIQGHKKKNLTIDITDVSVGLLQPIITPQNNCPDGNTTLKRAVTKKKKKSSQSIRNINIPNLSQTQKPKTNYQQALQIVNSSRSKGSKKNIHSSKIVNDATYSNIMDEFDVESVPSGTIASQNTVQRALQSQRQLVEKVTQKRVFSGFSRENLLSQRDKPLISLEKLRSQLK